MPSGVRRAPRRDYETERYALTALAAEAKRRGVSYGALVAGTTEWEQDEIIQDYRVEKRKKQRS